MAETTLVPTTKAPAASNASAGSGLSPPPVAVTPAPPRNLDELMLAMDVVDTLRHQDTLVARELNESEREGELLARLRQIYGGQGIQVPDRVLREGVEALKESRFVYTPPAPGLGTSLAKLWISRGRIGKGLLAAVAALGISVGAYQFGVVAPAERRAIEQQAAAERARIDLSERLPAALDRAVEDALNEAKVPAARTKAEGFAADGRSALNRQDAAGVQKAITDLETLRADLRREFVLRISAGTGQGGTGVFRVPPNNRSARNYYLIVDAVTPDGRPVSIPVTSEETRRTATVSRWAVRVSRDVFEQVGRDKSDDGIIQRSILGEKRRGELDIAYRYPVLGGAILEW
jgi:hypothetical protein